MHKGIILLTKAQTEDEAQSNVESFLEYYQDEVWDWYEIGGRWDNVLNPQTGKNILPATKCKEILKEWKQDIKKEANIYWEKTLEAREQAKQGKYDMSGYYAKKYSDFNYDNFNFDTNVYNIEESTHEQPKTKDLKEYFAVMVDLHN